MLEETINLMEKKENAAKLEQKSIGVQIELPDPEIMRCNECEYPAEDIYDLGEHMFEFHAEESCNEKIQCNYCGDNFKTKGALMMHRKDVHAEKVNMCSYFIEGNCNFGTDKCWYSHTKNNQKTTTFKCSKCEQVFETRPDFMLHKKKDHSESIPICREALNGTCKFGKINCWYNHENENEKSNCTEEVFDKLFDMIEKFTQRIVQIENNL